MASSNFGRRTVKLDNVRQNNIVYIDLSKELSESVFEQEYRKAARIIQHIIAENNRITKDDGNYDTRCKNRRKRKLNLTEFKTVVPFIGDRGTGKSSVMCSVLERLKYYEGSNPSAAFYLGPENDHTKFIAFNMIDANTLTDVEDVMEIILSRILTYLEDLQDDDNFQHIYRLIDRLHEELGLAHWKKMQTREEFGLTGLQRIADSQQAIEHFRELVEQFTSDVSRYHLNGQSCYLVVALDDLDMYQGANRGMQDCQFTLLEHIYSYMRVPHLIVLSTYNEHILRQKCNSHFERVYFGCQTHRTCTPTEQNDIEKLTGQFMSKLFPQEQRIYLPDYMFVTSANQSNLYVKPTLDNLNKEDKTPHIIKPFTSDRELLVKEFMLRLIAYKTGVYFDTAGTKRHFFEPRNLRELGELFQVIYSLEDIPKETADQEAVRGRNRQELLNYLYNTFALKHLDSEEYAQFRKLSMLPLVRQDRTLVDMIRQQRMNVANHPDSFGYLAKTGRDRWRYSYGELLHNLFYSTRIQKGNQSDVYFFSKEFLHCIFGAHSVVMNETVRMPNAHSEFLEIVGSSIAGRWANEMLPDFHDEAWDHELHAGSISLPVQDFFNWQIPETIQEALLMLNTESSDQAVTIIRPFLEALVIAGMFFTGFPSNGLKIALDADLDDYKQEAFYLRSSSEDHICFNVMNFAINLYNASSGEKGYLAFILDKLQKLGADFAKQCMRCWKKEMETAMYIQEVTKGRIDRTGRKVPTSMEAVYRTYDASKKSINRAEAWIKLLGDTPPKSVDIFLQKWDEILTDISTDFLNRMNQWNNTYKDFYLVLPVQHFDMMYNIIKRLANVSYHDIPEEAHVTEVYDYYVRLYKNIAADLKNQDQIYFENHERGFAEAFQDSVFYQVITAEEGDEFFNPYIKPMLVAMMRSVMPAQHTRRHSLPITL